MLQYNKGVSFYCKGKLSAGDGSLKSQFWTGEWILLKSKERHKFCLLFLLKCKMCLHPAYPAGTMEVDMSGHWTTFQSKLGCWKCSFPWGTGETTTITCLFMFSGGFLGAPGHGSAAHGMKSLWMTIHVAMLNSTVFHLNMKSLCSSPRLFSGIFISMM